MVNDSAIVEVSAIIAQLAIIDRGLTGSPLSDIDPDKIKLPGRDTPAERQLEEQLRHLVQCVHQLETKVNAVMG